MPSIRNIFYQTRSLIVSQPIDECIRNLEDIQTGFFAWPFRYKANVSPLDEGGANFTIRIMQGMSGMSTIARVTGTVVPQTQTQRSPTLACVRQYLPCLHSAFIPLRYP